MRVGYLGTELTNIGITYDTDRYALPLVLSVQNPSHGTVTLTYQSAVWRTAAIAISTTPDRTHLSRSIEMRLLAATNQLTLGAVPYERGDAPLFLTVVEHIWPGCCQQGVLKRARLRHILLKQKMEQDMSESLL